MIKAILFDADGTLIDSALLAMEKHRKVMKDMGLTVPTIAQMKPLWGGGWSEDLHAVAALMGWPEGAPERLMKNYRENYPRLDYQPIPGAAAAVRELHKMGLKLGIITNQKNETLVRRLKEIGIDVDLFFHLQAYDDHAHRKPDPRVFTPILERLAKENITATQTLFVGDIPNHDMAAARAHTPPIKFVAVTTGIHTAENFLTAGLEPDNILSSVADLPEWVKNK